jgi:hypothetical protein
MGIGHFLDADEIDAEAWRSSLTENVAEHVPGMRDCTKTVCSTRGRTQGFLRTGGAGGCPLDVYIDGIHQSGALDLSEIDPGEVSGMEVYTLTEMPPQYKSPTGGNPSGYAECGVLLIWMRH